MSARSPSRCLAAHLTRRTAVGGLLSAPFAGMAAAAREAAPPGWPARPLQLVVPWPAGGATDLALRVLAEEAARLLGQSVVVHNRPGASGTLVVPVLKSSPADGLTVGQLALPVLRHALMNKVPWDPLVDLSPILQVASTGFGLLVAANSPWRSVADMLAWARQHPGALMVGSNGVGTTPHLAMADLFKTQGLEYTHVPFKGTSEQMLALANGTLMAGVNSTGFAPWVEQGRLRLLAVFSAQRNPRWPQVPTMKELGYAQMVFNSPWGLVAPAGTPAGVVARLHEVFKAAMHTPRHLAELERFEQEPAYLDTEAYRQALLHARQQEQALLARMKLLAAP
ncbi:tripartite tricarboxylate transporter substrate binding protein [Roseateles sp. BYS180W]|uniref:Tripartite tricarboxylate transporter substrate binding protein n=1 Tax=Roseateles rivi TaxID=3299028 RepID=A0ABW7FRY0_9BURK